MFEPKDISPVHYKKLMDLNSNIQAIQSMIGMFQNQCEAKLAQHQEAARKVWSEIQKETGVDIDNIMWEPHPTEPKIVPVQANLRVPYSSRVG